MKTALRIVVSLPSGRQTEFTIVAHLSTAVDERLIEPAFYTEGVPVGGHHELEVLEPPLWNHAHVAHIHFHRVLATGRNFVCWTGALPTLHAVETVLRIWCVGTAYTMHTGADFGPEYGREPLTFIERMDRDGFRAVFFEAVVAS